MPVVSTRRRRRWIALALVIAVLVVVVPLAVYAIASGDNRTQPAAPQPTPGVATSAPASQPTGPGAPAQVGGIPASELLNGTFDIPAWPPDSPWPELPLMTKQVKFTNGQSQPRSDGTHLTIGNVQYIDVNGDGRVETFAMVSMIVQGVISQVAVFTRDAAGAIVPFGQVVAARPNGGPNDVKMIDTYRPGGDGRVDVRAGDDVPCCGVEPETIQYQWRTYGWTGTRFEQVGGPTAFGRDLRFPDLILKAGPLNLGAPVDGVRHGTLTVTISSIGTVRGPGMLVGVQLGTPRLTAEGPGWAGFDALNDGMEGRLPPPTVGGLVTIQLGLSRAAALDSGAPNTFGVGVFPLDKNGNQGKDAWQNDNTVAVTITLS
jgi:hypothetical protein